MRDINILFCLGLLSVFYIVLVSADSIPNSCSDSDGGMSYYVTGRASGYYRNTFYDLNDYCNGSVLSEYYCSGTGKYRITYTCAQGCSAGRCLGQPPNPPTANTQQSCHCSDSDGGRNYYAAGNVSGYCNGTFSKRDWCQDSSKLVEFFCGRDGNRYSEKITCPAGCANGRCLNASNTTDQTTSVSCFDNDGGINYLIKGTASGRYSNDQTYSKSDYCNRTVLTEYYCMGTTMKSTTNVCAWGCSAGRCNPSNGGMRPRQI